MKLLVFPFLLAVSFLFLPVCADAGTLDEVKIAGHLQLHQPFPYICTTSAPNLPCNVGENNHVVTGSLGVGYDLYILAQDIDPSVGLTGVVFGIDYDGSGQGVSVWGWTLCADLEFPGNDWPSAGSGNVIAWDYPANCQDAPAPGDLDGKANAVAGSFYLYAYGNDLFQITKRLYVSVPDFKATDCSLSESDLAWPEHAATIGFAEPGFDPCAEQIHCEVFPLTLDFDSVGLGAFRDTSFVITNIGDATLDGSVSASCDHFAIVSGASYSLPPGEADTVVVRFQPTALETHLCTIETGSALCSHVSCSGTGILGCSSDTFYVDPGATGIGDGSSWTNAFPQLNDALGSVLACSNVTQIWVAAGTYYPTSGTNRSSTFQLQSGLAIYGGFAGGETNLSERDWAANVTILSGDIGTVGLDTDNSYHVVTGSGADSTAVLDGFTITKGYADGAADLDQRGGGLHNNAGSPSIANVIFSDNYAYLSGGGLFNTASHPVLRNVLFKNNSSIYIWSGGGAVANGTSNPTFVNATFAYNDAGDGYGGGMHSYQSNPTLINTIFWGNTSAQGFKEINNNTSAPMVYNSLIEGGLTPGCIDSGAVLTGDPLFVDGPGGNLRLSNLNSPAFNSGRSSILPLPDTDLDGNQRVAAGTVDMGAYEFPVPLTVGFPSPCVFGVAPGNQTTCDTVYIVNQGGTLCTIQGISGCTTAPFSMDTTMTVHALAPGDTTTIVVCVTPTVPGPDTTEVTVVSDAWNSPMIVPVHLGTVTAVPEKHASKRFQIVSVGPNPFQHSAAVHFTLPEAMPVTATVWSVTGARVRALVRGEPHSAGDNWIRWDGRTDHGTVVAAGLYFLQVETRLGSKSARVVFLR
jgi:hypothetical protein